MVETWAAVEAPSSACITKGISGCQQVCEKILEAKGAIVLGDSFRTGRRARKIHEEGDRKTMLRKRKGRRKNLPELPIHPALKGAYEILMGLEGGVRTAEVV
jgi:IS5 family transposase